MLVRAEILQQIPGEIKRGEVSWTLTKKKMDSYLRVRRDQEEGGGAGLRKLDFSFASVVPQQQCYGHCPCDCSAQQLKQQLRNTLVATQ